MKNLALLLSGLQAAIAARAARDRTLTVLLVAVWARIARMGTRLERLIALWRAGKLPKPRAPRPARTAQTSKPRIKPPYPTAPAWLLRKLGHEAAAYGSQLRHLLTDAECADFLAACPQAGRIFRPLLRMLGDAPLPEALRRVKQAVPEVQPMPEMVGVAAAPGCEFLAA